jgi:inner membrane transporter RhtA
MSAAVLTDRAGAVLLAGPPNRPRRPRAARAVAGFAPGLVGPAYIVASCASLQTAAALATTVFATFGPAGTGALRFLAAALLLLTLVRPPLRARPTKFWLTITALGAATAATNFFIYEAIARIPLGTAVTLVFLGPLALALVATRRRLDVAWAVAAVIGVVLLTGSLKGASLPGVAFGLGAALSVATSILIARHVGEHTDVWVPVIRSVIGYVDVGPVHRGRERRPGVLARVTAGYRVVLSWASAYASLAWFGAIWYSRAPV